MGQVNEELKPLYELWSVASKFAVTFPEWLENKFETLDAHYMEIKTDEWLNELKRIQKTQLIQVNRKPEELMNFMNHSLVHFKKYLPMARTLRTKGMVQRHWKMIAQKLQLIID